MWETLFKHVSRFAFFWTTEPRGFTQARLVEYFDPQDQLEAKCDLLADMICNARHIIAFTGSTAHDPQLRFRMLAACEPLLTY